MSTFTKDNLTGENHEGKKANLPLRYLTASTLIGEKVINANEEKLGDVKDIMIDLIDGQIHYVVIELGGFLGIGEKFLPFRLICWRSAPKSTHLFLTRIKKH